MDIDKDFSFFFQGETDRGVLLLHGLTGTPSELRGLGRELHRQGFTVFAPTLAGHGRTEQDLVNTGWKDWYASARGGFLRLREKCRRISVAGLSMGATLSLKLALEFPREIAAVGVFGITLKYDGWNIPKWRLLTPLLPFLVRLPVFREWAFEEQFPFGIKNDRLRERILGKLSCEQDGALMRTPWRSLNELFRLNRHIKKHLSKITNPVIILHASEDDICSFRSNAAYLQNRLGGLTEVYSLPNSFHMVTIDSDRKFLYERTVEFFKRYG